MSQDDDLQQEILQRTLQEVAREEDGDPCVICLEPISEPAIAVPCRHANFDFLCLLSWLEQRRNCPLCKSDITSVKYDLAGPHAPKIYQLPALPPATTTTTTTTTTNLHRSPFQRGPRRPRRPRSPAPPQRQQPSDPIRRRQHIYRYQLYSLRVGSNRLSQYRELTPERFNREEDLVSRARKWIRRELQVFAFLNPESEHNTTSTTDATTSGSRGTGPRSGSGSGSGTVGVARPGHQRLESRRGNNAEFLLEYIIAILRTVDIKGSAGQAEELLKDFLGRENARLFLHELQAWLRSPFGALEDWDRNVRYDEGGVRAEAGVGVEGERTSTPVYRGGGRGRGRVSKPGRHRDRDALAQARRVQYARDRYIPD
ncbi:hypothetical protein BO70DRAFT_384122 [Aspergillus heteromorphus CBS 117.55]|uniref:RING-type E3 ubiquitin transferase n=1 Tax=Aspergillus heteromorphus CBS 117.55 TaxID=1448321 RepID=A0A317X218_9EURO|nr:uncharacterized protein BO70DRAFT_384122 [Aspergillus heteromorphus CBS 117.55]PWY92649.1 hypothetical protein BO70DRAFT_384122 [Aspergillus heteromorphus CBS 117.55]